MNKVLIVTNIPAAYRVDFFNLLAADEEIDFNFLFIPEKNSSHKEIIWGDNSNPFFGKSFFIKNGPGIKFLRSLTKQISKCKPNKVVVGGIPHYFPVIVFISFFLRYKIYCWWAGHAYTEKRNILKRYFRTLFSIFIDGYFFYSEYAYKYFFNHIRPIKKQYKIVGNNTRLAAIEMERFLPSNYEQKLDHNCFSLISIGFQEKRKNTILLLEAISILNSNNNWKINTIIIGDGPELQKLKLWKRKNNLSCVNFIGNLSPENVLKRLINSSLLIHPSYSDSWPQVYNEAAFCSIPILISSRAGVINEYTKKYKNLVLFDPFSPDELAQKIAVLLSNENIRNELGTFAHREAIDNDGRKVLVDFKELLK